MVGKVGRAHGLKGQLTIDIRTDEPKRRFSPGTSFATPRGTLTVSAATWHGRRLVVSFEEVADRTAAETLSGVELRVDVPADERPDDPEEFYDHQLVGLAAEDASGVVLGTITEVLHLPAQDVLVVAHHGRDVLVPFVSAMVPSVDLAERKVLVTDQARLFSDPPADAEHEA